MPAPFPTDSEPQCYISNMAVQESYRRNGLAKSLLRQAHRIGRWWGYEDVYLHFDKGNKGAEKLYRSAGYLPTGDTSKPSPFTIGPERVLMSRPLVTEDETT
mmetsp:Transcript_3213/g.11647  ORF Transcript_3213/g.11647 Transcript_3213/m.11647 type:complete len:102 (+) Transcript_3213:142-447(+)